MKNYNSFSKVLMPFGKSGNIYLFGAIGQGLGPVILTPILTRMLSVQSFGEITFIISFAAILSLVSKSWLCFSCKQSIDYQK